MKREKNRLASGRLSLVALVVMGVIVQQMTTVNGVSSGARQKLWKQFKSLYHKHYKFFQEYSRHHAFEKNVDTVLKLDDEIKHGRYNFTMKLNDIADLTDDEFKKTLGFHMPVSPEDDIAPEPITRRRSTMLRSLAIPDKVDWRERGFVTPVKAQHECGGCWAFAAAGALEAQWFKKTGKLVVLSAQNFLDCSWSSGNNGCEGGTMGPAFNYVKKNGGIDTDDSYPYQTRDWYKCKYREGKTGATCTGYKRVAKTEDALKTAVHEVGPIAVGIDGQRPTLKFYSGGIYDDPTCSKDRINHAVLVIGYGTEDGKDYWLVKNSWGPNWGMNGYVKMARNKGNQCGITRYAVYPTV